MSLARFSSHLLRGIGVLAVLAGATVASANDEVPADPAEQPRVERLLPEGYFLTEQGNLRHFEEAHRAGLNPLREDPHVVRTVLEVVLLLGIGEAYYWIHPSINKQDWDFPSGKQRLDNFVPTFDDNLHVTNDILHPFTAGSFYYWVSRSNGLSIPASWLVSFSTSAFFEFLGEYLERASINDLIMTPMAGWSPGELFFHVGEYLNSSPNPRWWNDVAAWTFGFPNRVHRPSGYTGPANPLPADNLGFSSYYWHRFQLLFGETRNSNDLGRDDVLHEIRLDAEIIAIPGFLRPGTFVHPFHEGELTEGHFRANLGGDGQQTWETWFDANIVGRYEQDISVDRVGHATMVALDTAYDFSENNRLGRYDAWAFAHLFGPAVRVWGVDHDLVTSFGAAIAPDFAVVQSQAWNEWVARFGKEGQKSELIEHGYYFALGWSLRMRAELEYRMLRAGGRFLFGSYDSIDKWDRFQDQVTRNTHNNDRILWVEAWLGLKVPKTPFLVRGYAEHIARTSNLPPLTTSTWDNRFGVALGLEF